MFGFRFLGALACLLAFSAAAAEPTGPQLSLPIDCEIGKDCYIQKYVDQDPDDGYRDYRCGPLSANKHDGTDIRLIDVAAMEQGVAVLAAASGTVIQIRNNMPDVNVNLVGKNAVTDRGLGNLVAIDHGNEWMTIYGHLQRNSVVVRTGEVVRAGQPLGKVGMSGLSEFPHVHFALWHNRIPVDPFTGPGKRRCEPAGSGALWEPATLDGHAYKPSFVMHSGFATRPMARAALQYGLYEQKSLPRKHGRLYFGVYVAGLYAGDEYVFTLHDSSGELLQQKTGRITRQRGVQFFVTLHGTDKPLPPGRYDARFTLSGKRHETDGPVLEETRSVTLQ